MTMFRTCLAAAVVLAAPLCAQARPPMAMPTHAPVHAAPAAPPPSAAPAAPVQAVPTLAAPISRHAGLLHLRRNHTVTSYAVTDPRASRPS
jgi:hypothetical protein